MRPIRGGPSTKYVLVREPREDIDGNPLKGRTSIKLSKLWEDWDDYSLFRVRDDVLVIPVEEWVPTHELELYLNTKQDLSD